MIVAITQLFCLIFIAKITVVQNRNPYVWSAVFAVVTLSATFIEFRSWVHTLVSAAIAFAFCVGWIHLMNRLRDTRLMWWLIYVPGVFLLPILGAASSGWFY